MVDFSTYKPPGVYIDETSAATVGPAGITPALMALVGSGVGYRTNTEAVVLTGTTTVTLAKLGIDLTSLVVRSVDGVVYVNADDYVKTAGAGADADAGETLDNPTTLHRAASGSTIGSGATVIVSYQYTDGDYFLPTHFTNFDDLTDFHGQPLDADGAIQSPVSLAARVAFLNGAREIVVQAVASDAAAADFGTAYANLLSEEQVSVIVPLPVGIDGESDNETIGTDLANHCDNAASDDSIYRIGIFGSEAGTDLNVDPDTLAASIDDERVVLVWPNSVQYFNGAINQVITVGGYYLAAAFAGKLVSLDPISTPMTRKAITGFANFPAGVLSSMTTAYKNQLSAAGVSVVERTRDGLLVCRHGVTTDKSSMLHREISLVRQRDGMIDLIYRTLLSYDIIGSPLLADTPTVILSIVTGALETLINASTIVGYQSVSVRQTSNDPTVVEVKFEYTPAYPLNYVVVSFSVNTDTGDITLAQQTP